MTDTLNPAPPGFTKDEWLTFRHDGVIHRENVLSPQETESFLDAVRECIADRQYSEEHTNKLENAVCAHPAFQRLIAMNTHIGYAYDIFGDQVRLSQNEVFVRPPGSVVNSWHLDGPRAVPYRVFSPVLPLKLRVGYWLTDVPRENMGNFVYIRGSHRADYEAEHTGTGDVAGQQVLTCGKGSMTIFGASLWHRIQPNTSDVTRINIFLSYTPSWVNGYYFQDLGQFGDLTREERIILRPYGDSQEDFIRPPGQDQPLFLGGAPREAEGGPVEQHKVRRLTRYEQELKYLCD